jgi:hypothetical protein
LLGMRSAGVKAVILAMVYLFCCFTVLLKRAFNLFP